MRNINNDKVDHIISEFLAITHNPTTNDWKRLIDDNPDYAMDIANFSVCYGTDEDDSLNEKVPLNEDVYDATISHVIDLVQSTPSQILEMAEVRVTSIQGAYARKVAKEIGIGSYVQLLNGVLVGRTLAPNKILIRLGERLEIPIAALSELFNRRFSVSEVPAFKSPNEKPKVRLQPCTWEDAVRAIDLPADETARLLNLVEEE